jgi:hypothetical protein
MGLAVVCVPTVPARSIRRSTVFGLKQLKDKSESVGRKTKNSSNPSITAYGTIRHGCG